MSYNKEELLALSPEEKIAIAEDLCGSVEDELLVTTNDDVAFAEERFRMHEANPVEGLSLAEFKNHFATK